MASRYHALPNVSDDLDPTAVWLTGVGQQLGPEGFQLLKALYCDTLSCRKLSDDANEPRDLYELSRTEGGAAASLTHVFESAQMPPRDALALFIHRLELLVPQPEENDLGANNCLASLERSDVERPTMRVVTTQESKMLECLVTRYVNMSPPERATLKLALAYQLSVHPDNVTIFEIFHRLFVHQGRKKRCKKVVAAFVTCLQTARSPRVVYVDLQQNLDDSSVPHDTMAIPDEDPPPVGDLDEELMTKILTLLDIRYHERQNLAKKRKRKRVCVCFWLCLPVALGLLLFTAAMSVFSTHLSRKKFNLEDSSFGQRFCPYPRPATASSATILVGQFNGFWHESVTVTQTPPSSASPYKFQSMKFYQIPTEQLRVHNMRYPSYNLTNSSIQLDQLYLLEGSHIDFLLRVQSINSTFPGFANLTICDTYPNYLLYSATNKCKHYQVTVEPMETKTHLVNFMAPKNSYYFVTTVAGSERAQVDFIKVDMIDVRFLNSSDFDGVKNTESSDGQPLQISLGDMLDAQGYVVVAIVSSLGDEGYYGQLRVIEDYRSFVYIVPAIAAAGLMAVGVTCVVGVWLCCYIIRRIIHRNKSQTEMGDYSNRTA